MWRHPAFFKKNSTDARSDFDIPADAKCQAGGPSRFTEMDYLCRNFKTPIRMNIQAYPPHPALRELVEVILIIDVDFTARDAISPLYEYVPTYIRFLSFYLGDTVKVKKGDGAFVARGRSLLVGPQTMPVTLDLGRKHCSVSVGLKPAAMYRLFGIPQLELLDKDYDACLILGKEINELTDRLEEAPDNDAKNVLVQRYLLGKLDKLKPDLPIDRAMQELLHATGNISVERLASLSCLSIRQFERQCHTRIGFAPKMYTRVVRFAYAYKMKELSPNLTWTEIGYRCGYFDQMHLIRDFKAFAGVSPGVLKRADIEHSVRFQALMD